LLLSSFTAKQSSMLVFALHLMFSSASSKKSK